MDQKYFRVPFATSGDVTVVPDDTQPDGSVSYEQGFPFDYQRELGVDPDAKAIERGTFNDLMFAITENIQQYQQFSTPEFITTADNDGAPYSYSSGARVRYDDGGGFKVYVSLADYNTSLPTDTTKWTPVVDAPATTAQAIAAALNSVAMTPLNLIKHPSAIKKIMRFTGLSSDGACTFTQNYGGTARAERNGSGYYRVLFSSSGSGDDMPNGNFVALVIPLNGTAPTSVGTWGSSISSTISNASFCQITAQGTTGFTFKCESSGGTPTNPVQFLAIVANDA